MDWFIGYLIFTSAILFVTGLAGTIVIFDLSESRRQVRIKFKKLGRALLIETVWPIGGPIVFVCWVRKWWRNLPDKRAW